MTIGQLEVLVKVVEAGSFTKAAAVLNMERSNVSRVIAQLETELDVSLLKRTTRRLSVSEVGREVYQRAVHILATVEDTRQITQRLHEEPRGCLRLTCSVEYGMVVLGPLIEAYLRRHPHVTVDVEYATRDLDVVFEGFDLAIRGGPLIESSLIARMIGRFDYGLYASPAYLRARGAPETPEQLSAHDVVHFAGGGGRPVWTLFRDESGPPVRVAVTPRLRVNTGAAVRSGVLAGLGIAQLPSVMIREVVAQGALRRVLDDWHPHSVPIYALYPSNRYLTPKVRNFVEMAIAGFSGSEVRS